MIGRSGLTAWFILSWALAAFGADWPRFRGVGGLGLGLDAKIPMNLSEESALWQIELRGHGHSSPVVAGKRLFYTVTPEDEAGHRDVVCVSTGDGNELWRKRFKYSQYVLHRFNNASSTSATVDEERVYLWWSDGSGSEVLALDHGGGLVWKRKLGVFESQHGCGSSVSQADDIVIVQKENLGPESFIAGLEAATGDVRWKVPVPAKTKTPYVTPVIRKTEKGKEAIFASTDNGLFCLDTKSGAVRWKMDPGFKYRVVATPVVVGDFIFASCGGGGGGKSSVVVWAPAGASEARERYRITKSLPYVPTGLGIDGRLFLVSDGGVGTCYDVKSGKLLWRERLMGKCFASLISVEGKIYAFGRDGDYKVFRASADFELLTEGNLGAGVHATPAVADGKLFVRTDEKLLCFHHGPED